MWRQHEGQGTRNSGRCSIDNLRRCKVCKRVLSSPPPTVRGATANYLMLIIAFPPHYWAFY